MEEWFKPENIAGTAADTCLVDRNIYSKDFFYFRAAISVLEKYFLRLRATPGI